MVVGKPGGNRGEARDEEADEAALCRADENLGKPKGVASTADHGCEKKDPVKGMERPTAKGCVTVVSRAKKVDEGVRLRRWSPHLYRTFIIYSKGRDLIRLYYLIH